MDQAGHHKIIILEENQAQRDFLKSVVEDSGGLAFVFDKETTFFNNFKPIDADLIIFRSSSVDKVSRIINTAIVLNYQKAIIIVTDQSAVQHFIESMAGIHAQVLGRPYRRSEITTAINRLLSSDINHQRRLVSLPVIVGKSPEIVQIRKLIPDLKHNNDAILIQGEKGTGKELLAKCIHSASGKSDRSFIKANVSKRLFKTMESDVQTPQDEINQMIPWIEKVLFDHNEAGTIYFEEIDAIPASFQGVLLRYFEGDRSKKIRVIASSHLKIDHLVQKGAFRKDLYFRLNVIKINIPALRERKVDIPLLADFFINKLCIKSGICHFQLSPRIKKALLLYHWPNNVDELESLLTIENAQGVEKKVLDRIIALTKDNQYLSANNANPINILRNMDEVRARFSLKDINRKFSSQIETELLKIVLEKTNWNRKQAAATLAISYKSLLNKIKAYNLNELNNWN